MGGIAPVWGSADLPWKVSRDTGYRSDSIAISRDMGPLRFAEMLVMVVVWVVVSMSRVKLFFDLKAPFHHWRKAVKAPPRLSCFPMPHPPRSKQLVLELAKTAGVGLKSTHTWTEYEPFWDWLLTSLTGWDNLAVDAHGGWHSLARPSASKCAALSWFLVWWYSLPLLRCTLSFMGSSMWGCGHLSMSFKQQHAMNALPDFPFSPDTMFVYMHQ